MAVALAVFLFHIIFTTTSFPPYKHTLVEQQQQPIFLNPDKKTLERLPLPTSDFIASHTLFFLHVPKTAGQSFTQTLRWVLQPYTDKKVARALVQPRLDLSFMARDEIIQVARPQSLHVFKAMYTRHFLQLGHVDTQIESAFASANHTVMFVTLLRRPIDRSLSHYCYCLKNATAHVTIYPTWLNGSKTSLEMGWPSFRSFVCGGKQDGLDNWTTRALSGCLHTAVADTSPQWCSVGHQMLQQAKNRLAAMLYVGLTEHYNVSIEMLLHVLRYDPARFQYTPKKLKSAVLNKNRQKSQCVDKVRSEGGSNVDRIIGEVEVLDTELYFFAEQLFWFRVGLLPFRNK